MTTRVRNLVRFVIVFIMVGITLAVIMDKLVMPVYVSHGTETQLFDVRDKQYTEAEALLRMNGFNIDVIDTVENVDLPSWTVIDQYPLPGRKVKKGREIKIVVSIAEKYFVMRNQVGKVQKAALMELERLKLPVDSIAYSFSVDKPEGVVVDQSIRSGFMVCINTPVMLTVSKGPPERQYEVPDLVGLNFETAKRLIKESDCILGSVREIPNDDFAPYTVIGQNPDAGTLTANPISVDLEVTTVSMEED